MVTVLGSLVVISTLLTAQATPPSEATVIRQRVKENQQVRLIDDQGREWQGRIAALTPDSLTLVTRDRKKWDVPYGTILRIDRPHDGVANGAAIGFISGAVLGLAAVITEEADDCEPDFGFFSCSDPTAGAYVLAPLVIGGLGAGIGVGIDALIRRDGNLYRRSDTRVALAPALGRGVRGFRVSVRW